MKYLSPSQALPTPVKAVFLDFDGVLLDSEVLYQRFWKMAFEEFGYQASKEVLLKLRSCDASLGEKIMSDYFQKPFPYKEVRERRKLLMSSYLANHPVSLKDGALSFLKYLKKSAIPAYIVSSSPKETVQEGIKRLEIDSYIQDVLSAKDVQRGKPYPDVYSKALRLSGLQKEDILVFEDSPNGIESAYQAGLKVVMVDDLDKANEETSKKIILEISNLAEIEKIGLLSHS